MRNYVEVSKVQTEADYVLVSVTCNKCGVTEDGSNGVNAGGYDDNFVSFGTSFGYGSRYDGERWNFDLCEDCLTELVKTFAIVPSGFGEASYYATYPKIMFEVWKATGIVDLEAGMTAEEIAERGGSIYVSDEEGDAV